MIPAIVSSLQLFLCRVAQLKKIPAVPGDLYTIKSTSLPRVPFIPTSWSVFWAKLTMLIKAIHAPSCKGYSTSVSEEPWSNKDYHLVTNHETTPSSYLTQSRDKILSLCESSEVDGLRGSEDFLWKVMGEYLEHEEMDAQFWWTTTGPLLAILLQQAKYQIAAQCEILLFYFLILVPDLGPRPDCSGRFSQWKSFMTDEGMPIELSWEWGLGNDSPIVRLSIEPIGLDAGTPQNTLNEFATNHIVDNVQRMFPATDLRLFHHFSKELLTYNLGHGINDTALATADHHSRSFIAFDFGKTSTMLKAYFFPIFKAKETGQSTLSLISHAIGRLAKLEELRFPSYDFLSDYLQTSPEGSGLEVEMLSIDCVSPASSRMKLYVRSRSTSFESVRANMTLDGKLKQRDLDKGIVELEKLWRLVLVPARHANAEEELPHKAHRTAGILYYYDFGPGQLVPTPRLYIPVRHYAKNDAAIVEGLANYLKLRGQDETTSRYLKALQTA